MTAHMWPVHLGGWAPRQCDEHSCGPAALLMLAASGDGTLASWLNGGSADDASCPPEVPAWAWHRELPVATRHEVTQRYIAELLRRSADGQRNRLAWPHQWGTTPSAAARVARFGPAEYEALWLTRKRTERLTRLVEAVTTAATPCLLYVGGDPSQSAHRRLPRHVVLAVPGRSARSDVINIFDPGSAMLTEVPVAELDDNRSKAAFGGWARPYVVVVPKNPK